MKKLTIKLTNSYTDHFYVYVNNNKLKFKNDEFGHKVAVYQTEENQVNINIKSKPNELDGKYWLLKYLLFFFVSIFGIFDSRYSKEYYTFNYLSSIKLEEDKEIELFVNKHQNDGVAVTDKNNVLIDNESNRYKYDVAMKKRRKIAMSIKYSSWVLIAIILVLIIAL